MNATQNNEDMDAPASKSSFQLKRRAHNLMVFELHNPNIVQLALRLKDHMAQAPALFKNTPAVLDLGPLEDGFKVVDFPALSSLLDNHGLTIVGICGGSEAQRIAATRARLALFPSTPAPAQAPLPPAEEAPTTQSAPPAETTGDTLGNLLLRQPVRAGQQVYARGVSLVIEASVNEGAEVIADGDIHIYGALRGRALAGARGRQDARIWCQHLDAELVSINGIYRTRDSIDTHLIGKPAVIEIQQDKLVIRSFG
ncbi:MAG: septum site-determining protein MinC [Pseudomonadota bacterium]